MVKSTSQWIPILPKDQKISGRASGNYVQVKSVGVQISNTLAINDDVIIIAAGTQVVAKPNQQPFFYFLVDKNHYLPYASINGVNEILLKSTLTIQPKRSDCSTSVRGKKTRRKDDDGDYFELEDIQLLDTPDWTNHDIRATLCPLWRKYTLVAITHKHEAECCCRRFQVFPIISNVVDGFVGQR